MGAAKMSTARTLISYGRLTACVLAGRLPQSLR